MADDPQGEAPEQSPSPLQLASTSELMDEIDSRFSSGIFCIALDDISHDQYRVNRYITCTDPRMLGLLEIGLRQYRQALMMKYEIVGLRPASPDDDCDDDCPDCGGAAEPGEEEV